MSLLRVQGISKSFRGLKAVSAASFDVEQGSIVALIGPNGAGKTTCFNMIAGVFAPDAGKVLFENKEIQGLRPDQVCRAGIGRTFQIVKPFAGLSVLDKQDGQAGLAVDGAKHRDDLVHFGGAQAGHYFVEQ